MKRYFIVFYNWASDNGKHGFGSANITATIYINNLQTLEDVKEGIHESGNISVVLTNIIELNENDFNTFSK